MAYRSSSSNTGTLGLAQVPSVAVPSGVASGDIIMLSVSIDYNTATFAPTTGVDQYGIPTGFTELFESKLTVDGHTIWVGWKRTTGADAGNYAFAAPTSTTFNPEWVCQAVAFSGRHASNNPTGTANVVDSGAASPLTVTATGVTATAADDLWWAAAVDDGSATMAFTAPSGITERQDATLGFANLTVATQDNVGAGATGNKSGTATWTGGSGGYAAYLIRIPAAAAAQTVSPNGTDVAVEFGTATVARQNSLTVTANGTDVAVQFGTPTVAVQASQTVTPNGTTVAVEFGSPTVTVQSNLTVVPNGTTVAIEIGTATVTLGAGVQTISPNSTVINIEIGVPTITGGAVNQNAVGSLFAATVIVTTLGVSLWDLIQSAIGTFAYPIGDRIFWLIIQHGTGTFYLVNKAGVVTTADRGFEFSDTQGRRKMEWKAPTHNQISLKEVYLAGAAGGELARITAWII